MATIHDNVIDRAFDDLAHSLRILLEADYRAQRGGLLFMDRAEAVGNIEAALSSVLNGFHSLYDAIGHQLGTHPIDWYNTGALAIILAIRNARHHNKANKIRTLYTYHVQTSERPDRMTQYVLVDFPSPEEGADCFDIYVSWSDLNQLLSLDKKESRLDPSTCALIRNYIGSAKFSDYASYYGVSSAKVFFNIVPIFVNAGVVLMPIIQNHLHGLSTEAKFFTSHFESVLPADTDHPSVECGPFVLPM
jgi:hypothetical protein